MVSSKISKFTRNSLLPLISDPALSYATTQLSPHGYRPRWPPDNAPAWNSPAHHHRRMDGILASPALLDRDNNRFKRDLWPETTSAKKQDVATWKMLCSRSLAAVGSSHYLTMRALKRQRHR